ncbi:MAG: hypothetical protein ABEL51_14060, partial [Salinibacter sp.]
MAHIRPLAFLIILSLLVEGGLLLGCQTSGSEHPGQQVEVETREGTWMSVDVAPNGHTLVFDLLGDLYALPVEGGEATRLTTMFPSDSISGGSPFDSQPRFSPTGDRIAFISDRSGSDNLWVMQADGTDPRQISHETGVVLNSPTWAPDGEHIAVRRSASLRTGELWV